VRFFQLGKKAEVPLYFDDRFLLTLAIADNTK